MILGRNAGLWSGVVAAAVNLVALALVVVDGRPLDAATVALFAGLNLFLHLVVGLVANAADPTSAATFAATLHAPPSSTITSSPPGAS